MCSEFREERGREGGRERKQQNSDRTTADCEGEKKGSWEGCKRWWAERRRLSSFTHPSSQAPQHLLLFLNRGQTERLRHVLERRSIDLTFPKAWSLFLSGTLTGCPPALCYVRPEVEQTQQALPRLHLWHASSGEIPSLYTFSILGYLLLLLWCMVRCCYSIENKTPFFPAFVSHLLSAATDRQEEAVSHCCVAELLHNHRSAPQDAKMKRCM